MSDIDKILDEIPGDWRVYFEAEKSVKLAIKQELIKARLDEVKLYTNNIYDTGSGFDPSMYEKNRIAELQSQLGEK